MAHRLYIYQSWLLPTEGAGIEIYDPRIGWSITELLPTVGAGIEMTRQNWGKLSEISSQYRVWIENLRFPFCLSSRGLLPAEGVWIENLIRIAPFCCPQRGARIEIEPDREITLSPSLLPAEGARIEIGLLDFGLEYSLVAPRGGSVD